MKFEPVEHPPSCAPFFEDAIDSNIWMPQCSHPCTFDRAMFVEKMMNLVMNPNLNSTWLFRADILYDTDADTEADADSLCEHPLLEVDRTDRTAPITHDVLGMERYRTLVRRLIPRNEKRDRPLDQTCAFYSSSSSSSSSSADDDILSTLIIYSPHAAHHNDIPYYHPKVRGIAHLHQWNPSTSHGTISIHFLPWEPLPSIPPKEIEILKLQRTAYHLLQTINKHGHATDYVKRVRHDLVVPRRQFQERYALLKSRYAKRLVDSWAENTDPTKHVFEDLGIAAFLIELWEDMYPGLNTNSDNSTTKNFPGFVDMACGNGLLVYILNQEGYPGYGFDARRRKSWAHYASSSSSSSLQERLLLPSLLSSQHASHAESSIPLHDGLFPKDTFIISNHGDELTPWTPLLASLSHCPFIVIPCCSHNFAGERFRAPPPRDKTRPKSAYASLVDWVARISEDCGWVVETEMLRIPSTRNTCLLGRTRSGARGVMDEASALAVIERYGGVGGYYEAVLKLVKAAPRGH